MPELRDAAERDVLLRIHSGATTFGSQDDEGWGIGFRREVDLTTDSARFADRDHWEARGYRPDRLGRWIRFDGRPHADADTTGDSIALRDGGGVDRRHITDVALPLYEGRMIGPFDFAEKGWVRGHGRSAEWRSIPWAGKQVEPQYLMPANELARFDPEPHRPKVGFMAVGSATNRRSMIATVLVGVPCGNSVPVLRCRSGAELALCAVLDSFVYDYALRTRLGGLNLNRFVLDETPLPTPDRVVDVGGLTAHVAALCWPAPIFDEAWRALVRGGGADRPRHVTEPTERLRLRCLLDAVVAGAFGLTHSDFVRILRDTAHPTERLAGREFARQLDPKGFWRIDKDHPPELRHTVLTLAAFRDLQREVDAAGGAWLPAATRFCTAQDGRGWELPETVDLAELGFEAPAGQRIVRARLTDDVTSS